MAMSEQQIAALWVREGGDAKWANVMARIAKRESGGRPQINNKGLNQNGTVDWGLYQVNDVWRKDPVVGPLFRSGRILTAEGATKAAIHILKTQGPKAWATYNAGTDKQYLGAFNGDTTKAPSEPKRPSVTAPQADIADRGATEDDAIIGALLSKRKLGGGLLAEASRRVTELGPAPSSQPQRSESAAVPQAAEPAQQRNGSFNITGPNPKRLKASLVSFAEQVAAQYGKPISGSDGTGHSRLTVNGNVSQHTTGNATDIPAAGKDLIRMGQAALIAAGMPRSQARKQRGGLYNVGGHQIIFATNQGGNHFDHLHISAR